MPNDSLLKPEEIRRLKEIREALLKGENPYSSIKGLPAAPPEPREPRKKDGKKERKERLDKWLSTSSPPKKRVTRTRLLPEASALISTPSTPLCPSCGKALNFMTSFLGEIGRGAFSRMTGEKVEAINMLDGEILEKDEVKVIPIMRKVRVCKDCKHVLLKVIQEAPDRSRESSNVLDEAKGCTQGLSGHYFKGRRTG